MKSSNLHSESVGMFFQSGQKAQVGHQGSPLIFKGPDWLRGTVADQWMLSGGFDCM